MKKKHSSERHLPEIRKRIQKMIRLSHEALHLKNGAASSELMAEKMLHAKDIYLQNALTLNEEVQFKKTEIQTHKKWIEKKVPNLFKRASFVSKYITTWDLDIPTVSIVPVDYSATQNKGLSEERKATLLRRRVKMNEWYCFYFGESHLQKTTLQFSA